MYQTFQKEESYIREYIDKFEELKRLFGDMSLLMLIDMFMRNTQCAVHDWYNELKRKSSHGNSSDGINRH